MPKLEPAGLVLSNLPFLEKNKMKLPKIQFKKSGPSVASLRKRFFDPDRFWLLCGAGFWLVVIITALIGINFFRSVYSDEYKETGASVSAMSEEMNISGLLQAVNRRQAVLDREVQIADDPSL